jgi:hypothetical protein
MPYALFLKSDNRYLGDIDDAALQFLQDNLEEESLTDTDYAFTRLTLEYLRGNGLDQQLAKILEEALGENDEVEIVFQAKE